MLLTSLLLTLLSVVAAVPASRALGRDAGWVLAAPLLAAAGVLIAAWTGDVRTEHHPWIPAVGVDLDLRLNGLALVFAMIVLVIGAAILAYSSRYLSRDRAESRPGSFYLLMTAFAASMLLLVLADNIVVLFVAWEFTSFTSFFLIGRSGDHARDPAIRTLLVTVGGGLALLAAVAIMMVTAGTASLSGVLASDIWQDPATSTVLAVLLALAAFTKSAQFPFQAWLPDSMVAISPVSAYLHAAAMVKAGVFLLLVFSPVLAGHAVWSTLLIACGLITALFGAVTALRQHDLKGLLAYSTMSQLGLLTAVIGIGTTAALTAAVVHTVAHALFKSALFMLIGIVDHEAGTRDLRMLAGRHVRMPVTGTALTLAAVSMAGVPPLLGFVSKEGLLDAALGTPGPAWAAPVVTGAIALASVFTVAYSGRLVLGALGTWGASPAGTTQPWESARGDQVHEAGPAFWTMPVLAAVAGVVLGLAPQALDAPVSAAAQAVAGAQAHAHLALWHGVTPALLLSAAVIATGLVLVLLRRPVERVAARTGLPFSALDIVDDIRFGLVRLGEVVGRHSGGMAPRAHLLIPSVMLGVLAVVGVLLVDELPDVVGQTARWHDWALVVLVAVGVAATLRARTRIAAMVVVGTVGFGVTLCDGGKSLRKEIESSTPDLVVLDLNMPEEDGLSIIRDLKSKINVPVIMLTATASPIDRVVGLEIGADDYVAKPCELRELMARIRSVLRRSGPAKSAAPEPASAKAEKEQLVRFGTKWLDLEAQALRDDEGNEHPLTASEFGLLKVFAANPKRVLSRERLLELANARDAEAFDRAVDLRIMRIRRKIEFDPTKPSVIRTIRGGGYLFSPTGDKA